MGLQLEEPFRFADFQICGQIAQAGVELPNPLPRAPLPPLHLRPLPGPVRVSAVDSRTGPFLSSFRSGPRPHTVLLALSPGLLHQWASLGQGPEGSSLWPQAPDCTRFKETTTCWVSVWYPKENNWASRRPREHAGTRQLPRPHSYSWFPRARGARRQCLHGNLVSRLPRGFAGCRALPAILSEQVLF